ncbi:MAG: transposase family protein, partial [Armatimonadota bacterium]
YVTVDDFCKTCLPPDIKPGPSASLCRSEVITLAVFGQWSKFSSERDFYRYADTNLRGAFPNLPHRSQFNRLIRRYSDDIVAFFLYLTDMLGAGKCAYEALDASAVPTRDAKRRGAGWLPQAADIGWSNRIGWYEGFYLLTSVNPGGAITGFCFASASTKEQPMAEEFFILRKYPDPELASVGSKASGPYIVDKGFNGKENHKRWSAFYGAEVICPTKNNSRHPWPKALRRWAAGLRQIVESVYNKLHNTFRLCRERPHDLTGFNARLAAKMVLHNFCIYINNQLGRPNLAFADLISW